MKLFASLRRGITKVLMSGNLSFFKNMGVRWAVYTAVVLLVVVGSSCRKTERAPNVDGVTESVKSGGVEVTVRVSDRSIRTSERLSLELTVRSDPSYQVTLPDVPEKLGSFFVLNTQTEPERLNDAGKVVIERIYTLEPDMAGPTEIPALEVTAILKSPKKHSGKSPKIKLQSKALPVQVVSVLNGGKEAFRDIAPDTEKVVEAPMSRWPLVALISNVIVVLCLFWVWSRWKKMNANSDSDLQRDWEALAVMAEDEKWRRMEPILSAWIGQRFALDLQAVDFQGVKDQLEARKIVLSGFDENLGQFNKLRYGTAPVSDADVNATYQMWDEWMRQFSQSNPNQGGEMAL